VRFSVLASGSSGNATVVEAGETAILIDCGLSVRRLAERATTLGFDLSSLDAVVVTHEHGDHIGGVGPLARRYGLPVYMTHGTRAAAGFADGHKFDVTEISPHETFTIGDLSLHPAPVPHDAKEPCQFVVARESKRLGILTDLGSDTRHIQQHFAGCCALVLEFNHDLELLSGCEYPDSVKDRIAGRLGHFNNVQASTLLATLKSARLRHVLGAHVSARANHINLVRQSLATVLGDSATTWDVAAQDTATPWIDV
jgi:phosphoribosyl 1,2-cyclic phosphodiesterase